MHGFILLRQVFSSKYVSVLQVKFVLTLNLVSTLPTTLRAFYHNRMPYVIKYVRRARANGVISARRSSTRHPFHFIPSISYGGKEEEEEGGGRRE